MDPKIILVAETGSDLSPALARAYGIRLVPMHVAFGTQTLDDGSFPPEKISDYYRATGRLPRTSGCSPEDFATVFDAIHAQHPQAHILYLAYSAVTTCSFQSAQIAAEGRDYITLMDTMQASAGQAAILQRMALLLQETPDLDPGQAAAAAMDLIGRARFCFMPDNLNYLRAGGRVSNAAYLGSRVLGLHPVIEFQEGQLIAARKYRGKMAALAARLIQDYAERYNLERDHLWLVYSHGLSEEVRCAAERCAKSCGFKQAEWVRTGGVITTHGGPGAFGLAGFAR